MKTFPLFGAEVKIPLSLTNFNVLHDKYEELTINIYNKFSKEYKKFANIEQVIDGYLDIYEAHLQSVIEVAISDLVANKVFNVNAEKFLDIHSQRKLYVMVLFDEIEAKYEEILGDQTAKNEYRAARKRDRGRWVSSSFGMSGAVKGAVKTGILNAGSGIAHSAVNVVGNTFTAIGTSIQKSALFNDPDTFGKLLDAVVFDCQNVIYTLIDILKKNGAEIEAVTDKDEERAEILFENISNPSFPKKETLNTVINAILSNPYEEKYYIFLIAEFGDENNEVEKLAEFFHVDISECKEKILREEFKKLPIDTLEEVLKTRKKITELCKRLGGVPNVLEKELEELEENRKYKCIYDKYNTYPKNSLDDWISCREQIKELSKELNVIDNGDKILVEIDNSVLNFKISLAKLFLSKLPKNCEEEAIIAKEELLNYCTEIKLSENNLAVHEINEIIEKFDISFRTVEGFEFDSREKSKKATVEKSTIDNLLGNHEIVSNYDCHLLLEYLDKNKITQELDVLYRSRCNDRLNRINKLKKRALTYQYRQNSRFKLFGGNVKSIIAHSIVYSIAMFFNIITSGAGLIITVPLILIWEITKRHFEERYWNELTFNGNYNIFEVIELTGEKHIQKAGTSTRLENKKSNLVSYIPGFRSRKLWKKLIATLFYLSYIFSLYAIFISEMASSGNVMMSLFYSIFLIIAVIPLYLLATNFLHIKDKLPLINSASVKKRIAGIILYLLVWIVVNIIYLQIPVWYGY